MALFVWQRTIVDEHGNVQPGAILQVTHEADSSLAAVYKDREGADPWPPGTVTADSFGFARFYAEPGRYRIRSMSPAVDWRDVALGAAQIGTDPDQVPSNQAMAAAIEEATTYNAGFTGAVDRSIEERLRERWKITDAGASPGADTASNLAAVNQAIAASVAAARRELELPPGRFDLSAAPTNPLGVALRGDSVLTVPVTGGVRQINTYADRGILVGKEYLYRVYARLQQSSGAVDIRVFGDSTVAGGYCTDPTLEIGNFLPLLGRLMGLHLPLAVVNAGVAGTKITDCTAASAVTSTTDLFIIKYGINDGTVSEATRLETFAEGLRTVLSDIRAQVDGQLVNQAILLVGPNSTSDTPNGRDERWYEQLRGVYVQAARDFQCAFFDTYAYLRDSRGAAGLWMDDPYSDGRAVHPTDVGMAWIWGAVMEAIFGGAETATWRRNHLVNASNAIEDGVTPSLPPSSFPYGLSMWRAKGSDGWPVDGVVIVERHADNVVVQRVAAYTTRAKIARRVGFAGTGWFDWIDHPGGVLPLSNGWVPYSTGHTPTYSLSGGRVTLGGLLKDGATAGGTVIGTLPEGFRPLRQQYFRVHSNNAGASLAVQTDGTIIVGAGVNAANLALGGITFDVV